MRRLALLLVALAVTASAGAATAADPGVSPAKVVLGGTVPLSGEAAAFGSVGPGALAYLRYVNARGGVHGRKIDYILFSRGHFANPSGGPEWSKYSDHRALLGQATRR